MDCGRAGLVQDDIRARMKECESLVDLMAPMTSTVASMVAPMVASTASLASMVEALDWLQWMAAESKSDDERVGGWIHKIREELTDGLPFLDCVVQAVTWARTKRIESLVDSTALMARIASTVALMVDSMVATMVALVASSRSKETTTARGDREGIETREALGQDPGECRDGESSLEQAEQAGKRRKSRKGSPDQSTAAVLKALPPKCLEQLVRSLSLMCWNMDFPEDWLCSLTMLVLSVKNELMG